MKKVQISQQEMTDLKMVSSNGSISWDNTNDKEIEVEFTESEKNVIRTRLNELDKASEISDADLEIHTLFNV